MGQDRKIQWCLDVCDSYKRRNERSLLSMTWFVRRKIVILKILGGWLQARDITVEWVFMDRKFTLVAV